MKNFEGYLKLKLGDSYVLLAGGGHKAISDFKIGDYLPLSGGTLTGALTVRQYIFGYNYNHAGANTPAFIFDKPGSYFTGIGCHSSGDTIWFGAAAVADGEASWIDSYKLKWIFNGTVTSDTFYGSLEGNATTATSAGNADTVDNIHASNLVRFFLSPLASDGPADSAKSWFTETMPSASGAIVYNVPGSEKTIIVGKSSGPYGHMLQLNYNDTYLRILRYAGGNWMSTDWEKISAGYADSAGSVTWANVTSKPAASGNATTPVYWNGSGFTDCTAYSSASVNYATSATYCLRFSREKSTYNANEVSTGIIDNYNSSGYWVNTPIGISYGSILSLSSPSYGSSLGMQLAWDTEHDNAAGTRYLWFRTGNNLGWSSNWKRIATDSDLSSYLSLSGGTISGVITFATSDAYGLAATANYSQIGFIDKYFWKSHIANMYTSNIASLDETGAPNFPNGLTSGGNITAVNFYTSSDKNKKKNFQSIPLNKLTYKQFTWKKTNEKSYGLIALEVELIYPELVSGEEGNKSVNYQAALCLSVGLILNEILEHKAKIINMEMRLSKLETQKLGGGQVN